MNYEIIISGFGGQGVLIFGEILSHGALKENKYIVWFPAYGPEQRGGTASCTVVIGDEEVASPISTDPDIVVVLNQPSLDKFEPWVKKGGLLIINKTLTTRKPVRDDIKTIEVDALSLAREAGEERATNIVLLGRLIKEIPILSIETIKKVISEIFSHRGEKVVEANIEALHSGWNSGD
ncbi:MAG: Pyruvate synthase subunit PorC [candidate division WS2 bacterium]|nr:Pyruvate synthase subunit PorC [Candidatus Lithacetigena glycinireducens]